MDRNHSQLLLFVFFLLLTFIFCLPYTSVDNMLEDRI